MSTEHVATDLPWVEKIAASFPVREFVPFHLYELPALITSNGHLAVDDLRGVAPLAFRVEDGTTFTWLASEDGVHIVDGDADGATLVEITEQGFSDFVNELPGDLTVHFGDTMHSTPAPDDSGRVPASASTWY